MRPEQDAYGQLIHDYYAGKEVIEIIEREDGHIGASALNPRMYFAGYEDWPAYQQEAMRYAQGRVLDIGCGAGRVALHLQGEGLAVVGIDNSPLAIQVCRARGVRDARLLSITRVSSALGRFDTIVMLGNNFGLFGNFRRARWLLRRFAGITSPQARIIAESRDIHQTDNPQHLQYQASNRRRGRMPGQIRLRVRHGLIKGNWFDYLMVSRREMSGLLEGTGWRIQRTLDSGTPSYIAILEKTNRHT